MADRFLPNPVRMFDTKPVKYHGNIVIGATAGGTLGVQSFGISGGNGPSYPGGPVGAVTLLSAGDFLVQLPDKFPNATSDVTCWVSQNNHTTVSGLFDCVVVCSGINPQQGNFQLWTKNHAISDTTLNMPASGLQLHWAVTFNNSVVSAG